MLLNLIQLDDFILFRASFKPGDLLGNPPVILFCQLPASSMQRPRDEKLLSPYSAWESQLSLMVLGHLGTALELLWRPCQESNLAQAHASHILSPLYYLPAPLRIDSLQFLQATSPTHGTIWGSVVLGYELKHTRCNLYPMRALPSPQAGLLSFIA